MINLKEKYDDIERILNLFAEYDAYSPYHQKLTDNLKKDLYNIYKFFGIRKLRINICNFNKGEIVMIEQDEGGTWMSDLSCIKYICLDEYQIPPDELFYE